MKRITSIILTLAMLFTLMPMTIFATDDSAEIVANVEQADLDRIASLSADEAMDLSPEEYSIWKTSRMSANFISLLSESNSGYIRNDYIEAYIAENGQYTMGTTGGNPQSDSDNNKLLLFGHPSPWSSETLIRIDEEDYFFSAEDISFSQDGTKCTATVTVDGVLIKQILSLQNNAYTQRADVVEIKYEITNNSGSSKEIGGRIMLDTMLGNNDGAPFKIPGIGDVTKECQYVGEQIPQYWQSFDDLTSPSVISSGTFYKTISQRPDKVQFAYWGDIVGAPWEYMVDSDKYLTGDSAVAAYYNPTTVVNGATKSFATYYGLSDFSFGDITGEVAMQVTAPASLEKNSEGTAYADNPFTITAYVTNQTVDTINSLDVTLNIPSDLVIGENDSTTKRISSLASGGEHSVSWQVWAKPQSSRKTIDYSISTSGAVEKNIPMTITLPAVSYYSVSNLSLSKTHLTMQKGKNERLIAYLDTSSGRQEAKKYEVRWSSSDPSVATVDSNGNVKAIKAGTTTIKAITADYKMYKTCAVTVRTRPTTDLDLWGLSGLSYKNLNSYKGKTIQYYVDNKNPYGNDKFYEGTIKKNDYYKNELGSFVIDKIYDNEASGLYAVSFLDCNDGIVIAYRGSVSWSLKNAFDPDWLADYNLAAFDFLDSQFYEAWYFYNQVRDAYPNKKIVLTGHSLGGALAAFVSIMEDVEAITFNGAEGLIIDLAYYMNANFIDKFNGLDNWKFKNHYNEDDFVGNRNPHLYESIYHINNGKTSGMFGPHDLITLIKNDSSGNIALSSSYRNGGYLYNEWTRNVDSIWYYYTGGSVFDALGVNVSDIKRNTGRVMLGTKNSNLKTLTAPGNWIEIRDNVFFSGGTSTMTGHGGSPDTFVFQSGDTMYGKGDNDTYITYVTYEPEHFFAEIIDPSGNDKIVFKNIAMSDLSLGNDDGERYRINIGNGNQIWVDKHRNWLQSEIKVVDKYGVEKNISELGNNSRRMSLMSINEPTENKITTLLVEGKNLDIDILDAEKNVLGTYTNNESGVITTEYAYVYTSNSEGNENIEIELLDTELYVMIKDGNDIKLSVLYGALDSADSEIFTAEIDLIANEAALVDGNWESENKFMYINGEEENTITVTELSKMTAIIPTLANESATFSLVSTVVEDINIYAGETVNIELTFEPENIALDDVNVELLDDNNIALISTNDNKISVKGICAGTNTLKITALDGSGTTISIPITVNQDTLENVTLTSNNLSYTENTWSDYPVTVFANIPTGYDTIVYQLDGDIYQSNEGIAVDIEGETIVKVYAKDTETGKITDTKTYTVKVDTSAPNLANIENLGVYYIDKLVSASDTNLDTISVNGAEFTAEEYTNGKWINSAGNYTIVATDLSGKSTETTIEFKTLPETESLTLDDTELINNIRNAFEDVKYDLAEERRNTLDSAIYELENRISYLNNPDNASNSILAFSIEGQIGEAYINEDLSTIQIEVAPDAIASEKTAVISVSDGATISPKPYIAQDFSNAVTYTVKAANGAERQWTVVASLPNDTTAPQIIDGSAVTNTITIVFDDHVGSITNEFGFALTKQTRGIANNTINNISYYENIVNVEFDNSFDEMEMGEYSLSIAANSIENISNVANEEASYTFTLGSIEKAATPTANKSGQVTSGTQVSLSSATEGATIYYTIDGTDPTIASNVYSSPIAITSALTLKAIAVKDGMADSDIMSVSFTIKSSYQGGGGGGGSSNKVSSPKANNTNKEVVKGTTITLTTTTKDAKIYYTLDGSTPTTDSTLYTSPIILHETTTIKMIAVKDKMTNSSVVTLTFNVRSASIKVKKDADKIPYMALRNDGKFTPDEAATRYEIITALAELFDIEKTDVIKQFSDVDGKNNDLVSLFSGASIIEGYPDGTFGGEKGITRAEFVKILTIMLNLDEIVEMTDVISDIDGHWAKDYILRFIEQGYVKGYPDKTFRPDNNITRAEVVTIINRIIEATDKNVTVSEDVPENHWAYNEIKKAMMENE